MGRAREAAEKVGDALAREPENFAKEAANLGDAFLFGADRYRSLDGERAKEPPDPALAAELERLRAEAAKRASEKARTERARAEALAQLDRVRADQDAGRSRTRELEPDAPSL